MEDKLNKMFEVLLQAVEQGINFATSEIPVVIHELLRWIAIDHLVRFGLHMTIMVVLLGVAMCINRHRHTCEKDDEYEKKAFLEKFPKRYYESFDPFVHVMCTTAALGLAFAAFAVGVARHLLPAIKVWIAPRLVLIDYIKTMIN